MSRFPEGTLDQVWQISVQAFPVSHVTADRSPP